MATNAANLVVRVGANLSSFNRGMKSMSRTLKRQSRQLRRVGRTMTAAVTLPLAGIAAGALKTRAEFESMEKALATVMGSSEAARRELERLRDVAQNPGIGFEQAVNASVRLQVVGQSAAEARELVAEFGNAVAASGGSADDLNEVVRQFSQILSLGKLTQENLGQITERAPGVSAALREAFGAQTAEQINAQVSSMDEFVARLRDALSEAPRVEGGLKNAFENIQIALRSALNEIGKSLNEAFDIQDLVERMTKAIQGAIHWFSELDTGTKRFIFTVLGALAAGGPVLVALGGLGAAISALLSPIGLVVAALAGLAVVAADLAINWEKRVLQMQQAFAVFVADIATKVGLVAGLLARLHGPVNQAISGIFAAVEKSAGLVLLEASKQFNELGTQVENTASIVDRLIGKFEEAKNSAKGLVDTMTGDAGAGGPRSRGGAIGDLLRAGVRGAADPLTEARRRFEQTQALIRTSRLSGKTGEVEAGPLAGLEGLDRVAARATEKLRVLEEQARNAFHVGQEGALLFGDAVGSLVQNFTFFGDEIISAKERLKNFGRDLLRMFNRLTQQIAAAAAQALALKAIGSIFGLTTGPFGMGFGKLFGSALIPGFANGGMVFGPRLALVGEGRGTSRRNPEMISPANQMMGFIEKAVRNAGMGGNVNVTGQLTTRGTHMQATLSATDRLHNRMGRA